jgi:hypothetical protein
VLLLSFGTAAIFLGEPRAQQAANSETHEEVGQEVSLQ